MSSSASAALVRGSIEEVWNDAGGASNLDRYLSSDYVDHAYSGGRPELERAMAELRGAFTQVCFVIDDLIAEPDRVAARLRLKALHTGPFRTIEASGNAIEVNLFRWYRVANGRIAEHWALFDTTSLLRQIGGNPPSLERDRRK